MIKSN